MKQKPILKAFTSKSQASCIRSAMRGEEGDWFRTKIAELQNIVDSMPVTYETERQDGSPIAYLHYFIAGFDAYIYELDRGDPDDSDNEYQTQAYGLVDMGFGPESGYISIPEIVAGGAELDLHWTPKSIADIRKAVNA
jgi:hypothetical protein